MLSEISIASLANALREELELAADEVIEDIAKLVSEAGYKYLQKSLGGETSGFSKYIGSGQYAIGFNTDHFWNKGFHRFTVSHELGHVSTPDHRRILEGIETHFSKPEFQKRDDDIEREADRFAVNFLTPQRAFKKQMEFKEFCPDTVFTLANHFGTSVYATILRYVELTDQSCVLVVCSDKGQILYEKRSQSMYDEYRKMRFLNREPLKQGTLVHDWICGNRREPQCRLNLEDWYDDCPEGIEATESVIALGYRGVYFALLIPDDFQVHDEEEW